MPSLMSLPNELLTTIASCVRRRADIASLRLVNRCFESIATPFYFTSVPLYAHWSEEEGEEVEPQWPNGVGYDARVFAHILDDEKLRGLVRKVDVYMCNPDCVSLDEKQCFSC